MAGIGRSAVAGAVVAACLWGAWHELGRMRLNRSLRRLESTSAQLLARSDDPGARVRARSELANIEGLVDRFGWITDLHMIAAVNYRTLGQYLEAERHYEAALSTDSRPEILLNLGTVLLQTGKSNEAVDRFAEAVEYDPSYLSFVPPTIQREVTDAVRKRQSGTLVSP